MLYFASARVRPLQFERVEQTDYSGGKMKSSIHYLLLAACALPTTDANATEKRTVVEVARLQESTIEEDFERQTRGIASEDFGSEDELNIDEEFNVRLIPKQKKINRTISRGLKDEI